MNTDLEITLEFLDSPTEVDFFAVAGAPGHDGQDGAPGRDGADGHTPVITASKQGNTTTISVDGDPVAQILDGATGAKGDKGDKGDPGQDGAKGDKGDTGAKGDKGDKGDTGAQGIQGIQGEKGETGAKGDKGDTDATGAAGQDGYTPVKGTDYWTAADKAEIVEDVTEEIDLSNYVQKTDYASSSNAGVVKVGNAGVVLNTNKILQTLPSSANTIKSGSENRNPIVPAHQHESTFYGLAKAAGDSTQSASSNAVGNYTDAAKVAIQKMLGIYEAPWELIREDTVTNATSAAIDIIADNNGNTFEITDIILKLWIPSSATGSSKGDYGRVYCYYDSTGADYFYMKGLDSANKIAFGKIEQRNNLLEVTFTKGISMNDDGLSYGTLRLPTSGDSAMYKILENRRFYNRIVITAVTGTASYRVYGKRKWQ